MKSKMYLILYSFFLLSFSLTGAELTQKHSIYEIFDEMKKSVKERYSDKGWNEYVDDLFMHPVSRVEYLRKVGLVEARKQFHALQYLKDNLKSDKSDVVVFGVGTRGYEAQEIPRYLKRLSNRYPDKNFKIYSISNEHSTAKKTTVLPSQKDKLYDKDNAGDLIESKSTAFERYKLKSFPNVEIVKVAAYLPMNKHFLNKDTSFLSTFKGFLSRKLAAGAILIIQDSFSNPRFLDGISELFYDFKIKRKFKGARNLQYISTPQDEILVFDPPRKKSEQYNPKTKKYEPLVIWNDPYGDFFLNNKSIKFAVFHPLDFELFEWKKFKKLSDHEKKLRSFDFILEKTSKGRLNVVGVKGYRLEKPIGWPPRKNRISILD